MRCSARSTDSTLSRTEKTAVHAGFRSYSGVKLSQGKTLSATIQPAKASKEPDSSDVRRASSTKIKPTERNRLLDDGQGRCVQADARRNRTAEGVCFLGGTFESGTLQRRSVMIEIRKRMHLHAASFQEMLSCRPPQLPKVICAQTEGGFDLVVRFCF